MKSAPTEAGRSSARTATCSPFRKNTATHAISPERQACTNAIPNGRPTANGSRTSATLRRRRTLRRSAGWQRAGHSAHAQRGYLQVHAVMVARRQETPLGRQKQPAAIRYIDSRQVTLVAQAPAWEITEYSWSPDSKWIAFARPKKNDDHIQLYGWIPGRRSRSRMGGTVRASLSSVPTGSIFFRV